MHVTSMNSLAPLTLWLVVVAGGCAQTPAKPDKYPASETLCQYVGLESAESPQHSEHSDQDSISLLAVYRFREPHVAAPKEPMTVKFQVDRSHLNELRSHLEAQPEVICTPDRDAHYHVQVRPFAAGQAQAPEPEIPTRAALPAPLQAEPGSPATPPPGAAGGSR